MLKGKRMRNLIKALFGIVPVKHRRLDESLSHSIVHKAIYGTAGYEIDTDKIVISASGNVHLKDEGFILEDLEKVRESIKAGYKPRNFTLEEWTRVSVEGGVLKLQMKTPGELKDEHEDNQG